MSVTSELYAVRFDGASEPPTGWQTWTPRDATAPAFTCRDDALHTQAGPSPGGQGAWTRRIPGIQPGEHYRLTIRYRAEGAHHEHKQIYARLLWLDEQGQRQHHRDQEYFPAPGVVPGESAPEQDGWKTIQGVRLAPDGARGAEVRLVLAWAPDAQVWWRSVELEAVAAPPPRTVTLATVALRPKGPSTPQNNVDLFCRMLDQAGEAGADIVCLPEDETKVAVPGATSETIAEPIPGPILQAHAERARKWGMYVVACYAERAGDEIYNTAVLIDRNGDLVGRYRKTHLPNEEVEDGRTQGGDYPVFETDFGTVGMMICWDVTFPECARALALRGAEIILMPIWGGNEILMKARCIENDLFLVTSSYGAPTGVLDRQGDWLDVVRPDDDGFDISEGKVVTATVDLGEPHRWAWVGDFGRRMRMERRPDLVPALAAEAVS